MIFRGLGKRNEYVTKQIGNRGYTNYSLIMNRNWENFRECQSNFKVINRGVPQDNILGPLLYLATLQIRLRK
jgi:hypothetical protein